MKIKFTNEQLLLTLNYDTNVRQVFSLYERCLIHKAIHRDQVLPTDLFLKVKDLLLKLKVQNYKPKHFTWVENIDKGGYVLLQSKIKESWNYLK